MRHLDGFGLTAFRLLPAVAVAAAILSVAFSQPAELRSPQLMEQVDAGFSLIYNLDYKDAQTAFEKLRQGYPEHPAPPLYIATAIWLKELFERQDLDIDNFISPSYFDKPTERQMPAAERERFFALVAQSQKLAESVLQRDPGNLDARYFLGSAEGILASFAITIDRSKTTAFDHGKKAYRYHKQLVEENGNYYDAYMSVGLYEYVVGNLPWYIKWLAAMVGYRGSVERGFEYLSLAASKGQFVRDDARVLQMVLFVREKRFEEALRNVRVLIEKAPRNFIVRLNEAYILEQLGRSAEAVKAYRETLVAAEAGKPNFNLMPLETMRFTLGRKFWELKQPELALSVLDRSLKDPATPQHRQAPAQLLAGQILDTMGRRQDALERYQKVLELQDVGQAHRQARKYMQQAYSNGN